MTEREVVGMDAGHWLLVALLLIAVAIPVVGFGLIARMLRKDEAIDAATFLALRELRERFEQTRPR